MRLRFADGISTVVTAAGGFNASANDVFAPAVTTGVDAVDDTWTFVNSAKAIIGNTDAVFKVGVTGLAGNTGIFSADVIGYEFIV